MVFERNIDHGKEFDWGKASGEYGKYRDIYPEEFYQKIVGWNLCTKGQSVLDLGTGTGVLPRHLYRYGACFTASDLAVKQIEEARRLSKEAGMEITYLVSPAEELSFPAASFDTVTACQCFFYFDPGRMYPNIASWLKPGGRLGIFYMVWLPGESEIARQSEELVLSYNPDWSGAGAVRQNLVMDEEAARFFTVEKAHTFDCALPFTRESWNGRMIACRGIGASSLSTEEKKAFETEHQRLLKTVAPERFTIPHSISMLILRKKED